MTKLPIPLLLLLLLPALLLIMLGLAWLAGILAFFAVFCFCINRYLPLIRYGILREIIKTLLFFFFLLSSVVSFKLLVFDIYKIPSPSMENLLYPGDVIMVNKLTFGPKLPRSPFEIPWVNLAFYSNKKARARIKETWWDYTRWGGFSKIKQGDVFVFSLNTSLTYFVVKRCVGLPGDTIQIKNGEIYTNSVHYRAPKTVKNRCSFRIKNKAKFFKIIDSLKIDQNSDLVCKNLNKARATFSVQEWQLLTHTTCIDSIKPMLEKYDSNKEKRLKIPNSQWTLDNMGPIIIPKKGMQIELNPTTFMLYEKAINLFEKNTITHKNGAFYNNQKKIRSYTFQFNYYFVMGDNRKKTMDSRSWGFLPETNIIGKVQGVLFSNKDEKFQWDRLIKML